MYKINHCISNRKLAGMLKRLNHYQRMNLCISFAGINEVYNNVLHGVLRFVYFT